MIWRPLFVVIITVLASVGCIPDNARHSNGQNKSNKQKLETAGFGEVTGAKDGEFVTVTDWIDPKYLCLDVNETQRDLCTTALNRSVSPPQNMEIKLWVCSQERLRNCIVFEPNPENNIDMRKVFVYDNAGKAIDFDGTEYDKSSHSWNMEKAQRLKLTGRVTVVGGQGQFVEPIEKIEAE